MPVESFYLMIGSFYFMRYRSDWQYTSAYDFLQKRFLRKGAEQQGFDLGKKERLERLVKSIESEMLKL